MQPDVRSGSQIDFLIVIEAQINNAVVSKTGTILPGLGIEADHAVSRGHIENPLLFAVRPVGWATTREQPGRGSSPRPFQLFVHPF